MAEKITIVYKKFDTLNFIQEVREGVMGKTYTQRIEIMADLLAHYLPQNYLEALAILMKILGPENTEQTGMFSRFYWLMPIGKFVEK